MSTTVQLTNAILILNLNHEAAEAGLSTRPQQSSDWSDRNEIGLIRQ